MKTFNEKEINRYKKLWWPMCIIIAIVITVSCSKEDEGSTSFVTTSSSSFTISAVNNCTISSGLGTILSVNTPYQLSEGQTIVKLLIQTTVSNGESEENILTTFRDNGSTTTFANCFRFGSETWVKFKIQLESSEGIVSNSSFITINKPNGAE